MSIGHLELLVEEPSAEVLLGFLIPKIAPGLSWSIHSHGGKDQLLKRLPGRLRGYSRLRVGAVRIVVLLDRDRDDCNALKGRLEQVADSAGLTTRRTSTTEDYVVVNRIAVEELEAWYFGDWDAVRSAYPRVAASIPNQARYRDPDAIAGGTCEAFERVLRGAGYFAGGLRKIEAAREIAPHLEVHRNRSASFRAFCDAIQEAAA